MNFPQPAPAPTLMVDTAVAQHVGDRAEQQDRVEVVKHPQLADALMVVLADGAGGHTGGAQAASEVIIRARQTFLEYEGREPLNDMMHAVLLDAHQGIRLSRFTCTQDPHSTAVALIVRGHRAQWAHCGDSRLYHVRGGRILHRSEDHSQVALLLRKGAITAEQVNTHPKRNVLLSCLGGRAVPQIVHGGCDALLAGDAFLLCSDGLWAHFSEAELATALSRPKIREVAAELLAEARKRAQGRGDNVSLAIVRLRAETPFTRPAAPNWTLLE